MDERRAKEAAIERLSLLNRGILPDEFSDPNFFASKTAALDTPHQREKSSCRAL